MNKALRNPLVFILFVLPALALFLIFFIYPIFNSIYYSLTSWNGVSDTVKMTGLTNYEKALGDDRFWISVKNNGWFILFSVFIQVPLIVLFSLLIANVKKLKGLYKTAVFMPSIMSTAVIGILWGFIYEPNIGLFNKLLGLFGIDPVYWLSDERFAMLSILITNAWQWTGFYIVMVLAAILAIPGELEEAAAIDGATGFQRATRITLPLIVPIISVVIMLSIAGAMKAADIVIVMTKGGPAGSTEVMATYMIKYAITNFKYGYGNTIAVLIFVFTLIVTVVYQLLFNRRSERIEY
ncbi:MULTISPECIES: sugar ABC transporter permease [unclassified Paenibacillus]|uniref:carbohydrate ABC transporter permease n=1 Tax=unclassified Paenibacillus TaxID=185978 RepID=UPI002405529C|nr:MULTISPECIES: sugar ABC transporter permease [unclassified Paenibacillus]MDF9840519.1 raffinose/stachyose/melibiose transport system permease protein [Paenibacillus sp. PastF-2]MDF9847101.1 raffinose/stachyose/melibiose transport system permease protein [Paenibacillus sp. PastM-2]MDF9853673.1 raffinose/stachyose/melibiose transport system permease protein [Paenibacillus sp. PastF-1]MDH6478841.1 raffinose/stachyose/melibiose transport system permease protein [Paenibacillus sp. PastH-2]MDH650